MQLDFEFEACGDKEYKVDSIWNSAIYARELAGQLPRLYFLVSWKSYPKEENTWEPALVIQYLWKLVTIYYQDNPEKPIVTSAPVNMALPMARSTALPMSRSTTNIQIKRKQGQLVGSTTIKQVKKS